MRLMSIDAYLEKIQTLIDTHGWAIQGVGTTPPFVYTVGLSTKQLPEIVVMGLPFKVAQTILNQLARQMTEGKFTPEANRRFDEIFEGFSARFVPLTPTQVGQHLRVACAVSDELPQAWQLIWPDPSGKFEEEEGVDPHFVAMQNLALTDEDEPM